MRLVRRVRGCVIQHRVESGRQRLQFDYAGKDGAVANFSVDYERRALRDLKGTKFRR